MKAMGMNSSEHNQVQAPGTGPSDQASAPLPVRRTVHTNTGNPRITVAFPFSRISIGQADPAVPALADVVARLAEAMATLADGVSADDAEAIQVIADEARALTSEMASR